MLAGTPRHCSSPHDTEFGGIRFTRTTTVQQQQRRQICSLEQSARDEWPQGYANKIRITVRVQPLTRVSRACHDATLLNQSCFRLRYRENRVHYLARPSHFRLASRMIFRPRNDR